MSPRIEARARCARCGHVKTGLSMYEMLLDPGPCPSPECHVVRVEATVGRPVPELEAAEVEPDDPRG